MGFFLRSFIVCIYEYVSVWVCVHVPACQCGCRGERTTCRSPFSFPSLCIPGIELKSLDVAARASTHCTILLAHHQKYNINAHSYQWLLVKC